MDSEATGSLSTVSVEDPSDDSPPVKQQRLLSRYKAFKKRDMAQDCATDDALVF